MNFSQHLHMHIFYAYADFHGRFLRVAIFIAHWVVNHNSVFSNPFANGTHHPLLLAIANLDPFRQQPIASGQTTRVGMKDKLEHFARRG